MFRGEYGDCDHCKKEHVWIVNKSRRACQWCNERIKKFKKLERKPVREKKVVVKTKKTLLGFFQAVWATREHVSEISGTPLGKFDVWNFAHILSKKAYPKFEEKPENICLMTREEHDRYDNRGGVEELAETHIGWRRLLKRKDELKRKYHH